MHAGAFDQSAAALRPDVLMFETAPLDHDLEVTGSILLRRWIASDAPDTDFTAKLIDVYPPSADLPGRLCDEPDRGVVAGALSRQLGAAQADGVGRGLCDHHRAVPDRQFVLPGHRLRLDISSSNFPHFDVNPNSGEPEGVWQQPRIARNRLFTEAARPSHVLLPIIPSSEPQPA